MKYKIVKTSTTEQMEAEMDALLKAGWRMYGYLMVKDYQLVQVVTKGEYVRPARLKEKQNESTD